MDSIDWGAISLLSGLRCHHKILNWQVTLGATWILVPVNSEAGSMDSSLATVFLDEPLYFLFCFFLKKLNYLKTFLIET